MREKQKGAGVSRILPEVNERWLWEWEQTYQPLDVRKELDKMELWLQANPKRRKRDYFRFIINWLNRAHAQVIVAQTTVRVQAKAGEQTGRVGCWVDGVLDE